MFLKELTGSGFSGPQARAMGGFVATVTAAGSSSQANSTLITASINNVTSGGANTGVRLPAGQAGDVVYISNSKTETLFVYPPTGGALSGNTADAKVDIVTLHACVCVCMNTIDWLVVYNA